MRTYSLRRRIILWMLALECSLAIGIGAATIVYSWHEQIRAFDLTLRGRADSLLGAVDDAEDPGDNVTIDPHGLDLPAGDMWQVTDPQGHVIARSHAWSPGIPMPRGMRRAINFRTGREPYRGIILHGVRRVDADLGEGKPGIARPVVIFYASPLHPIYEAVGHAAQFLLLSGLVLLTSSGLLLVFLLRRGLAPIRELSEAAAQISPSRLQFHAPERAARIVELSVLAGALESSTRSVEQAFHLQQTFVHDAAHELKTAVTIVKSSLQLAAARARSGIGTPDGLEACLTDCDRMEELVQRMLLLARYEQLPPESQTCEASEVIEEVAAQLQSLAELKHIDFRVAIEQPARVPLSSEACSSLIAALTLNALQHTPAKGKVEVTMKTRDTAVDLSIRDTGRGIPAHDLPRIFDRFYRGDYSRSRMTGGTGLGLSICRAIVDSCKGHITISSQVGVGTTAEVQLPKA